MPHLILAETYASVSELKGNSMATVAAGEGFPVAILNHHEPTFSCVPAKAYEALAEWRNLDAAVSEQFKKKLVER